MKFIAEYKIQLNKNYMHFYQTERSKVSKRIKSIIKRVAKLKEEGCIIRNIKSKHLSMYDEPWFYFHVRIWK